MNKMIKFDSSDWNSIKDTINKINEIGCPQSGKTEDGETIIFDVTNYGDGDCLVTSVLQKNGWIRKNVYDPVEHIIEETYEKQ